MNQTGEVFIILSALFDIVWPVRIFEDQEVYVYMDFLLWTKYIDIDEIAKAL